MSHEFTGNFGLKRAFLRHRPAFHLGPSLPGTWALNHASGRYPLHREASSLGPSSVGRGGRTGDERGPPRNSGHGHGGCWVLRPQRTRKRGREMPGIRSERGRERRRDEQGYNRFSWRHSQTTPTGSRSSNLPANRHLPD